MKKLIYLLAALFILNSCGILQTRELQKNVMFIDYTPYIEAGFYLSPNDYPGPHTPVGELHLIIDPAVVKYKDAEYDDPRYTHYTQYKDQVFEVPLDSKQILEMAVSEATKRRSNGISNLKIEVVTQDYPYYRNEGLLATSVLTMPVSRYIVSGVLIRIMDQE